MSNRSHEDADSPSLTDAGDFEDVFELGPSEKGKRGTSAKPLGFDPYWAHLRKLAVRTRRNFTSLASEPVEEAWRQHALADDYVQILTGESTSSFEVFPDQARVGSTIIWSDNWTGKAEKGSDGRLGHRLRTKTTAGRSCSFWVAHEHCVGMTGISSLSRRQHRAVIGIVTHVDADSIALEPILIGQLHRPEMDMFGNLGSEALRVWPSDIDEFTRYDMSRRVEAKTAATVSAMPERAVKAAFASIIGERHVPKDWGGERSDLNTVRLRLAGSPVEASFVLKGPAANKIMTIATLGKNGDQIARAMTEEPDLVVVQHYGAIDAEVRKMLERYCFFATYQQRKPTRWLALDGDATAGIFKAYGVVPKSRGAAS